jgi:putative SOS response-associated peptidase YedK
MGLVGIGSWDMQCKILLSIGRCLVPVSGLREREREREREDQVYLEM